MNRRVWLASLLLAFVFIYLTRGILLPFMAGLAAAYFLDPAADMLERRRVPRGAAAAIVIAVFALVVVGVVLAFWPILQAQISSISATLPKVLSGVRPWLNDILSTLSGKFGVDLDADVESMLVTFSDDILAKAKGAAGGVLRSGLALFNILTLLLISPVVAFYLLRDWDLLVAKINSWLPPENAGVIRRLASQVDTVLAGFVRGQLLVSTSMGVLYGVGWSLAGLDFGIVLGVLAGVLSFVPFVGALLAAGVAVAIAIGQWGFDPYHVGMVAGVFVVVQTIESGFLTPRLVGERVGLHAVWVLFAVMAGGEIMGFLGVLVAVPVAAAMAVLVRYYIDQYLEHYDIVPVENTDADDAKETEKSADTGKTQAPQESP